MTMMPRLVALMFAALLISACEKKYENIPPNDIGMVLTPTGYEDKVYTPGQVDIGETTTAKMGNRLVLIQRSAIQIKEQFLGGNKDGEDHRCLVGPNKEPMAIDVRLVLALPDYETPDGRKDLNRLFLLGNPRGPDGIKPATKEDRVLRLAAESVYNDQAQLQVRGKIRQICAQYKDFDSAFAAFSDEGPNGLSKKIERAVAQALVENKVPLHLVNAVVSNMKPDQTVTDAIAAKQAAQKRVEALEVLRTFLANDPDGTKKLVYKMQAIQEIISKADEKGRSMIYMMDLADSPKILPQQR